MSSSLRGRGEYYVKDSRQREKNTHGAVSCGTLKLITRSTPISTAMAFPDNGARPKPDLAG